MHLGFNLAFIALIAVNFFDEILNCQAIWSQFSERNKFIPAVQKLGKWKLQQTSYQQPTN